MGSRFVTALLALVMCGAPVAAQSAESRPSNVQRGAPRVAAPTVESGAGGAQTTSAAGSKMAPGVVAVAYIDGLSGGYGSVGQATQQQLEFALAHASRTGWAGRNAQFRLTSFDGGLQPQQSVQALQQALDQGARIVFTSGSSAAARALGAAVAEHNALHQDRTALLMNVGAGATVLTQADCGYWQFRTTPTDDQRIVALLSRMKPDRAVRRVFIVNQDHERGREMQQRMRSLLEAESRTLTLVGDATVPAGEGATRADDIVAQAQRAGADTILTGAWGADLAVLVRAVAESRRPVRIYAAHADTAGLVPALADVQFGSRQVDLRAVMPWSANSSIMSGQDLRLQYGATANEQTADLSDGAVLNAVRLLSDAVRQAGTGDALRVAQRLEGLTAHGFNGRITMRAQDHQLQQPLAITGLAPIHSRGVRFDEGHSGLGWRVDAVVPAATTTLPSSCAMARPNRQLKP